MIHILMLKADYSFHRERQAELATKKNAGKTSGALKLIS